MKTKFIIVVAVCFSGLFLHSGQYGTPGHRPPMSREALLGYIDEARARQTGDSDALLSPEEREDSRVSQILWLKNWALLHEAEARKLNDEWQALAVQNIPTFVRILKDQEWLLRTLEMPFFPSAHFDGIMEQMVRLDGYDICSVGNTDILEFTRRLFHEIEQAPGKSSGGDRYAAIYLSLKGTADDRALFEKILPGTYEQTLTRHSLSVLNARACGTNLLDRLNGDGYYRWSTNSPSFIPSVANTGPQAAYVYDLLKQALAKYGGAANIPPELATMEVSFDMEGNPVCSVDLAKYGLAMPGFAPPHPPSLAAATHVSAAPPPQEPAAVSGKAPPSPAAEFSAALPSRSRRAAPLAAGAGLLAALLLWRGLRRRKP